MAWEMRPEQQAFQRAVRMRYCSNMPRGDDIDLDMEQKYSMLPEDWQIITQQRKVEIKAMDDGRWREMRAQLDEELKDATKAELNAKHELHKPAHIEEIESLRREAEEKTTREQGEKTSRDQHIDKRKRISFEDGDDDWTGNLFDSTDE